jgi:uncharacterized protein (DUF1800 family)
MSVGASFLGSGPDRVEIGPRVAVHLLNRIGFGPRPGDVNRVLGMGLDRYVQEQLDAPADPELDSRLRGLVTLGYPISQVLSLYNADQRSIGVILDELYTAKIIRAVHAQNQLQEVMVDFWFNHFSVFIQDGFARYSTPAYEREAIRPYALGKFRELLGATAAHPAMLYFLDNYLSRATVTTNGRVIRGLNENYGRELLELHTVGVDAGYTQDHVIDAARCFTGWGIDNLGTSGRFVYRSQVHDTGAKSVFGLDLPAGGGKDDGDKLLDYLASHPRTAAFIARKLAQRFVADDPPARVVDRAADTFLATGGDIRAVVRAILGSSELWAEAFGAGKPKTPFEFVASAIRAVDGQVTSGRAVVASLQNMGMPLYACVPPTGYANRGADWLNPSSHLYRMNFALDLAAGAIAGVGADVRGMVRRMGGNSEDPRSVAGTMSAEIFGKGLSRSTLDAASRVTPGGPVSVAARVAGLCLASPEMQAR